MLTSSLVVGGHQRPNRELYFLDPTTTAAEVITSRWFTPTIGDFFSLYIPYHQYCSINPNIFDGLTPAIGIFGWLSHNPVFKG